MGAAFAAANPGVTHAPVIRGTPPSVAVLPYTEPSTPTASPGTAAASRCRSLPACLAAATVAVAVKRRQRLKRNARQYDRDDDGGYEMDTRRRDDDRPRRDDDRRDSRGDDRPRRNDDRRGSRGDDRPRRNDDRRDSRDDDRPRRDDQKWRDTDLAGKRTGIEDKAPMPRQNAAPWKKDNAELRNDPSYAKRWEWDPDRRGKKNAPWSKGKPVDQLQEKDEQASALRALYKRPRFGWKDVMTDDLRMSTLNEHLPAIGNNEVWLSKFLAHTGSCSRRDVTEMVLQGRVEVNGEIVQSPAIRIDPTRDRVNLDGQPKTLRTLGEIVWIMVHKPKGVLSTMEDPLGRKTIMDIVPFAKKRRLVPIGRIDRNAAGLMLMTNDYEWHTVLTHPRHEHSKEYQVKLYNGVPSKDKMRALQTGLQLPDEPRPLRPIENFDVQQASNAEEIALVKFTLREGRYRQIRRMFEYIGHPVKSIKRVGFGLLWLDDDLRAGDFRMLSPKEIRKLKGPTILRRPTKHPDDRRKELQKQMKEVDNDDGFDRNRKMNNFRSEEEDFEDEEDEEDDSDMTDLKRKPTGGEKPERKNGKGGGKGASRQALKPAPKISYVMDDDDEVMDDDDEPASSASTGRTTPGRTASSRLDAATMGDFEGSDDDFVDEDRMQASKDPTGGSREAPVSDVESWEQSWMEQLDAMSASKKDKA